jgi:hypothetical protein
LAILSFPPRHLTPRGSRPPCPRPRGRALSNIS